METSSCKLVAFNHAFVHPEERNDETPPSAPTGTQDQELHVIVVPSALNDSTSEVRKPNLPVTSPRVAPNMFRQKPCLKHIFGHSMKAEDKLQFLDDILSSSVENNSDSKEKIKSGRMDGCDNEVDTCAVNCQELCTCDLYTDESRILLHQSECSAKHHGNMKWKCMACPKSVTLYNSFSALKSHKMALHSWQRFTCDKCEVSCSTFSLLERHRKSSHSKQLKYSCQFCDKAFCKQSDLRNHVSIHLNLRQNVCEKCGQSFSHISNLIRHSRLHSGSKPYLCKICGKRFIQLTSLKEHQISHHENKPIPCPALPEICKKEFRTPTIARRHAFRMHPGIKWESQQTMISKASKQRLFHCTICGETFPKMKDLRSHSLIHKRVEDVQAHSYESIGTAPLGALYSEDNQEGINAFSGHEIKQIKDDLIATTSLEEPSSDKSMDYALENCIINDICGGVLVTTLCVDNHLLKSIKTVSFDESENVQKEFPHDHVDKFFEGQSFMEDQTQNRDNIAPEYKILQTESNMMCMGSIDTQDVRISFDDYVTGSINNLKFADSEITASSDIMYESLSSNVRGNECDIVYPSKNGSLLSISTSPQDHNYAYLTKNSEFQEKCELRPANRIPNNCFSNYSKKYLLRNKTCRSSLNSVVKPFLCKHCGKQFSQLTFLRQHKSRHHKNKLFECPALPVTCKVLFRSSLLARQHALCRHPGFKWKSHQSQYLHHCNICQESFFTVSGLQSHRLLHENKEGHSEKDSVGDCEAKNTLDIKDGKEGKSIPDSASSIRIIGHHGNMIFCVVSNTESVVQALSETVDGNCSKSNIPPALAITAVNDGLDSAKTADFDTVLCNELNESSEDHAYAKEINAQFVAFIGHDGLLESFNDAPTSRVTGEEIDLISSAGTDIKYTVDFHNISPISSNKIHHFEDNEFIKPNIIVNKPECIKQDNNDCVDMSVSESNIFCGSSFLETADDHNYSQCAKNTKVSGTDIFNEKQSCDSLIISDLKRPEDGIFALGKEWENESVIYLPRELLDRGSHANNLSQESRTTPKTSDEPPGAIIPCKSRKPPQINRAYLQKKHCPECGKHFEKMSNFRQHLGTHFPHMQRYECKACDQRFSWKSTLNKHMKAQHSLSPQQAVCDTCGKIYASGTQVQEHIRRDHLLLRPHSCDICSKAFFKKHDLQIHVRVHTNEKPYTCFCGWKFRHISHMKRHQLLSCLRHKCQSCGASFNLVSELKAHKKSHSLK